MGLPATEDVKQLKNIAVDEKAGPKSPMPKDEALEEHGASSNARKDKSANCTMARHTDNASTMCHELSEPATWSQHPTSPGGIVVSLYLFIAVMVKKSDSCFDLPKS